MADVTMSPVPKRKRSGSANGTEEPPASRRRSQSPETGEMDTSKGGADRDRQLGARMTAMELGKSNEPQAPVPAADQPVSVVRQTAAQAEFAKLVGSRSGGVYMPPARLKALQEAASSDKSSPEYQRLSWDALRKSITGMVNRVNIGNIKQVTPELFAENLIRGRGLFVRSIMKAQAASLPFTPIFAALVSIMNTKLPQVGELLVHRLVSLFRRAYKRNDKIVCLSTTMFIAHLVNQQVADHVIVLEMLMLMLDEPTDDSTEVAVGLTREVGAFLQEYAPKANNTIYESFRTVLNRGKISQRVQYMIEVLMQVRKDKYKDHPILSEGLDLVEEEDQITHTINLQDPLQVQEGLNIFKFDPNYLANEEKYKQIKTEILGDESGSEESGSDESDDEQEDAEVVESKEGIEDRTETNLVNLRRIIYLTIMNALNYEEAVHKLLKVQIPEGSEIELANMIIECCSQERSYSSFYGLIGERFCKLNRIWMDCFESAFNTYYTTVHRYETNRLRNIARFFGHLVSTDSISWHVFECIHMNEDDTTSSSRIFVKIMAQEMLESMGLKVLKERFADPEVRRGCQGMFPMDNPKNTRFSINYFSSIGLGVVTEEMREWLKNAPKMIMEQRRALEEAESSSDSDSSDSDSSSDSSSSDSDSSEDSRPRRRRSSTPPRKRGGKEESRKRDDSPPARRRGDSHKRGDSPPARRRGNGSPPPASRRREDDSPPPRRRDDSRRRGSSPPPSRRRNDSPPPRRRRDDDDTPPRGRDDSRPRDASPRRSGRQSPPARRGGDKSPVGIKREREGSPAPPSGPRGERAKSPVGGGRRDRSPAGRRERSPGAVRRDREKDRSRSRSPRGPPRGGGGHRERDGARRDSRDRGYERDRRR